MTRFQSVFARMGLASCCMLSGLAGGGGGRAASAPASAALVLERTIPLQGSGRIDHLAADVAGGRLFVAELGAGAVEAIDVASGHSLGRITGLKEPQGLAYLPGRGELVVATGGDGSVRFYRAADLALLATMKLGDDADNVRIDLRSGQVVVGYGAGALAVIDPANRRVLRTATLPAHPESFQLDGDRAFVNLPNAGQVAVVDLAQGRQIGRWPHAGAQFNFPMALADGGLVAVVYRLPGRLALFRAADGSVARTAGTCGDADDVFADRPRQRLYVVCGSGALDVFDLRSLAHTVRIESRAGARTGLFVPDLDRLFVAARADGRGPAALLVYRPAP